jgi:hypothetical protein
MAMLLKELDELAPNLLWAHACLPSISQTAAPLPATPPNIALYLDRRCK